MSKGKSGYQWIAEEAYSEAMEWIEESSITMNNAITMTELCDIVGFRLGAKGRFDDEFLRKHPHNPNSPKQDKDSRRHTLGAVIRRIGLSNFEYYRPHPKYPKRKMVYK